MKANDVLGCVGGAAVLLLASAYIPFFGSLFSLLTPLPILYYSTKLGLDRGVKLAGATILFVGIIAAFTRYIHLLFLCIEFSLLGLIMSELFRRKMSVGYTILLGTSLMLLVGFAVLAVAGLPRNKSPMEMIISHLQGSLNDSLQLYQGMGANEQNAFKASEYLRVLIDILLRIYPALTVIGTGFVVWFNVIASKPLFRMRSLRYPDFGPMDRWAAPELMVWAVIASGFSLFLPFPQLELVAINALVVLLAIYFFHGLSILLFFLNKYRVALWIRFGVYALILFQQIFVIVLAAAGLFDQWIDFRRIHPKKTE